nr:alpha/beta hydrolase [uncultured Mediterraneibacter sp.]
MRFTKYNSMTDILKYPQMREYLQVFYSEYLFDMYPKELYDLPIAREEQVAKTPWGEPFSIVADQLMDAVNLVLDLKENHTRRAIALWEYEEENGIYGEWTLEKNAHGGKERVCLITPDMEQLKKEKSIFGDRKRPAVIICPGGGYEEVCFSGEGTPVMYFMEANGYGAFMLKYRVGKDGVYPAPQEDLARAIRHVRAHAEEYQIDPKNVMVLGGSAGGHLCASEAALYGRTGYDNLCLVSSKEVASEKESKETGEEKALAGLLYEDQAGEFKGISAKPDKVALCYPVISLEKEIHEGSAKALTGGEKEETELLRHKLSVENLVTEEYPPTFVWTCADDDCVPPSNAVRMGEALEKAGVPHELHVYPTGGHGCALAYSKSAHDWSQAMLEFFQNIDKQDRD